MSEKVLVAKVLDKVKEFKKGKEIKNSYFEACWSKKGKWKDLPEEGKCNKCRIMHTASYSECIKGELIWVYPTSEEVEKRTVVLALRLSQAEVLKEVDEVEEGFEGTAVEFCEKHGDASYTGFKECLKEIRKRLKVKK
ncbi:hypothetical protein LCGC14_1371640 [marine sediment metagenome]|uniref:Uncharacterized protein n=1 Tax=marine sediment metagenome TaxID=412755 RepID=A0A0F9N784_9ZZZZ